VENSSKSYAVPYAAAGETRPVTGQPFHACERMDNGPRDGWRKFLPKNLFSLDFGRRNPIQERSSLTDF
jgi:hypothetical protein